MGDRGAGSSGRRPRVGEHHEGGRLLGCREHIEDLRRRDPSRVAKGILLHGESSSGFTPRGEDAMNRMRNPRCVSFSVAPRAALPSLQPGSSEA